MKDLYIKAIEQFMESEPMKRYLIERVDTLDAWQISDLVCGARYDIREKCKMLQELAETGEECFRKAAAEAQQAIQYLSSSGDAIYLLTQYSCDEKSERGYTMDGSMPYLSVEQSIKGMREEFDCCDCTEEELSEATFWYGLERYEKDDKGELKEVCDFEVTADEKILFVSGYREHDLWELNDSRNLNLPIPFEIGDIVTIDCRPFAEVKHGVIVEKGDNRDCCCVQCAWVSSDGNVRSGALKHNMIFDDGCWPMVSALYRLSVFDGALDESEKQLKVISDYVYRSEEKGHEFNYALFCGEDGMELIANKQKIE